jgi:hypothetical protein
MDSPPAMGASRSTGGIFRAKAYGNKPNHADFPKITDIPQAGNQQVVFKVFAYLVYGDPITVDVMPRSLHSSQCFFHCFDGSSA